MPKGNLADERRGILECPECKARWSPNIKPNSHGRFEYGSQQCPYCKEDELREKCMQRG